MAALLAGSLLAAHLAERIVDRPGNPVENAPPLYDILHEVLPDMTRHEQLIDLLPIVLGLVVVYLVLFDGMHHGDVCRMLAYGFLLRCVTTTVTRLPSPICSRKEQICAVGGCNSCIFSGHAMTTLVLAYFIHRHTGSHACALAAYCLATSWLIVATRSHYTVDVIVAWIVVYALVRAVE